MNPEDLSVLFPHLASYMRNSMSTLYLAALQLAPPARRETDPELDANAALLDQSYYRLTRLLNTLTSAKYLNGPLPLRDGNIVELFESLFEQVESLSQMRELNMSYRCAMESHTCAFCADALEQVFYHLISNAFKFTPPGGNLFLELRLSRGNVLFSIRDDGPGIPQERLEHLFEIRPNETPTPPPHGVGLGLPLCKGIAAAHGGMLMVESRPGKGSCFTLSLPDRKVNHTVVSDSFSDYAGGFNRTLLALADALPPEAFLIRNQG